MKIGLTNKTKLLLVLTSTFAGAIATTPSNAATFTFSQASLAIDNFNQKPQDVKTDFDVDGKTISQKSKGKVFAQLDPSGTFSDDGSLVFANANAQSAINGTGSNYLGYGNITSQAIGTFFFETTQEFKFDFSLSLNLSNAIALTPEEAVSSNGRISFSLVNSFTQEVYDSFDISAYLATDLTDSFDSDFFSFDPGENFAITTFSQNPLLGGANESYQAAITGSFAAIFPENTQVTLIAEAKNKTCSESSQELNTCVKVPEPSNQLSLLLGLGGLLLFPSYSRVMKQIIKLSRQPIIK
jgi:hypothetical protein